MVLLAKLDCALKYRCTAQLNSNSIPFPRQSHFHFVSRATPSPFHSHLPGWNATSKKKQLRRGQKVSRHQQTQKQQQGQQRWQKWMANICWKRRKVSDPRQPSCPIVVLSQKIKKNKIQGLACVRKMLQCEQEGKKETSKKKKQKNWARNNICCCFPLGLQEKRWTIEIRREQLAEKAKEMTHKGSKKRACEKRSCSSERIKFQEKGTERERPVVCSKMC